MIKKSAQVINKNITMIRSRYNILVITLLLLCRNVCGNIFCANDNYETSYHSNQMQFTKELVDHDYVIVDNFKNLHCCAKGYRSIEWFKDGKSYPWSSDETSSLILYPEAANQTIYARKASKIDEGKYTCVLRNATHKMEHQIELKVKSSSPDIPLATFKPVDQFANIDGSARFYCEAFVGKKVLPDIAISIQWYHTSEGEGSDDNLKLIVNDEETFNEEVVNREDEQIIGSYLTIKRITLSHYGRYLCRVEMGNSNKHRLEMSASLINALPIEASAKSILINPIFLGSCAAIITFLILFRCIHVFWLKHMMMNHMKKKEVLKLKHSQIAASLDQHQLQSMRRHNGNSTDKNDDIKIPIGKS